MQDIAWVPYLGSVSRHFYIESSRLAERNGSTRYVVLRIVVDDNFIMLNTSNEPYGLMTRNF